jgi:competence protein ComEA
MRSRSHRPWKEEVKDMLSMHAGERIGFVIVLSLCLAAAGYITYDRFVRSEVVADLSRVEVVWKEMSAATGSSVDRAQRSGTQTASDEVILFKFDPNHLPVEQWVALGLTERQAAAIHRFEEKGGRFKKKHDLAKMRVIDPELFARWEPYILLPDSLPTKAQHATPPDPIVTRSERPASSRTLIELNTADSATLVALPGIGPSFAKGILKYRDRLGGYHSLDQLAEVYVLRDKPEAIERLRSLLVVDTMRIHRHPINLVTAEELGPHPYAGWKVAKALVAYRKQHGPFTTLADVKGCVLVTDSVYRKLAPYLSPE